MGFGLVWGKRGRYPITTTCFCGVWEGMVDRGINENEGYKVDEGRL